MSTEGDSSGDYDGSHEEGSDDAESASSSSLSNPLLSYFDSSSDNDGETDDGGKLSVEPAVAPSVSSGDRPPATAADSRQSSSPLPPPPRTSTKAAVGETPPKRNSLLVEAERQAAIAAALTANASTMSPSMAAGIAKVMSLGGNFTAKSATSGSGAAHDQPHSNRQYPPPPRTANNRQHYNSQYGSPTVVALPPLSAPVPLPPPRPMMKPVRFRECRMVFGELLVRHYCLKDGEKVVNDDAAAASIVVGEEQVDRGVSLLDGAVSSDEIEEIQVNVGRHDDDDGDEGAADVTTSGEGSASEEVAKTEDESDNSTTTAITMNAENGQSREGTTTSDITQSLAANDDKVTTPTPPTASVPDSFLRFLLLVAKVPIIVEEGGKQPQLKAKQSQSSLNAATAAARRALEIYIMAQTMYESISERQQRSLSEESGHFDATTSFFAACAGEIDAKSPSSKSNDEGIFFGINDEIGVASQEKEESRSPSKKNTSTSPTQSRMGNLLPSSSTIPSSSSAAAAVASASAVFSNVLSKVAKKQGTFSDIGKKLMSGNVVSSGGGESGNRSQIKQEVSDESLPQTMEDYEVIIDQEMLGLTVENVLERTIIRTLLSDGAAKRAGAKVGSLIAKVGNIDTSNLTHFETIDELRQSQRPLKLTLRYIGSDVLRCAREEMGRLIRGREEIDSNKADGVTNKPWRENLNQSNQSDETFNSILRERWPSKVNRSLLTSTSSSIMTRQEMLHQAGRDLIRILTLLVVGMEKELASVNDNADVQSEDGRAKHLTTKELNESIEITSKILLDYARRHPDVDERRDNSRGGSKSHPSSSFHPLPPGRVQGKKHHGPPKGKGGKGKKSQPIDSPLLRIGDALQRTTSFLVEPSSTTTTTLRWEIIDYLCGVLDLDTEQELAEKEAASSTEGGDASPINDLGSAGSILKLIVLNRSAVEDPGIEMEELTDNDSVSTLGQSSQSGSASNSGNCFLTVVHRLAASKSTSARVSACSLGPVLWSHLDFPRQLQLRGVITRALHDVEVIVRKATATVLHEIAELVFDRRAVPWLVLMCERSMTDPEPQLRAAAMTLTWHLAEHLPNAFLGDARKGSSSIRRLPPRTDPTFMDVYLLQCKLLPVASNLAEDRIASVRLSVAAQCDRLCNALGEHWFSVIIDLLQALISDGDDRVRSEAILCMPRLVESVVIGTTTGHNITVLESLLPQAVKIQKDSSTIVRSALATACGELLVFLVGADDRSSNEPPSSPGRAAISTPSLYKKHVDDTLIPILQKLLQDTNPEVTTASLRAVTNASRSSARDSSTRIPTCSHRVDTIDDDLASISSHQSHTSFDRTKPVFIPVLSEEQVLRLLPTLSNLATSAQWRVRQSAVEIVPALLGCTYRHETRHEISKFCVRLMGDKVDSVRRTAAECLCLGGSSLARHGEDDGGEWITNIVIPHLKSCSRSDDSKQRLLSLKMIEIIITNGLCPATFKGADNVNSSLSSCDDSVLGSVAESPVRMILDIAASLASDRVANVRLNVGRVLAAIMLLLETSDVDFSVNVIEKQLHDERGRPQGGDRDVVYFAQQALMLSQSPRRRSLSHSLSME
eukprot:scaffold695_cov196-Alexandrium_tamarense.AAC.17